VHLARKLTDEEWERFVAHVRETFDARGTMTSEGSLRQWSNGNLLGAIGIGTVPDRCSFHLCGMGPGGV
jgi:hypothetical protein